MAKVGAVVKAAVATAIKTIAADPTLKGLPAAKSGYLKRWVTTWKAYVADPKVLPTFFFARYGYAVEALTVNLLAGSDISPYTFQFQVSHGHTRPDIVVRDEAKEEIAWIDITSEGSPSHIYNKTGAGWKSRPYVAEVRYDVPVPAAWVTGGKLDPKTAQRFKEAAEQAALEDEAMLEATEALATKIGDALTGQPLVTKSKAGQVIREAIKEAVGQEVTPIAAKSILGMIETLTVGGREEPGASWAGYAFAGVKVDSNSAKDVLLAYGKRLLKGDEGAEVEPLSEGEAEESSEGSDSEMEVASDMEE